jgi:ATP-dependent Zn protease
LGDLLKAMRAEFSKAKGTTPCIIFIDELDSFGDRNSFHSEHANYSIQVINGLLECLDGVDGREGVVVIGATNNPAKIDPALLRSGRFDNHIAIGLPDSESRMAIMREELALEFQPDEVGKLETLTSGFSGADLTKVCREARRIARRQRRSVTTDDILANLPSLVKIDGEYRRTAAIHEAGHALVGWRLGAGKFLGAIIADQVNPSTPTWQIGVAAFEHHRLAYRTRQHHLDRIAALLAGMAAEELVFGEYGDGAGGCEGSDLEVATNLATLMEAQHALGDRLRYSTVSHPSEWEALRRADRELAAAVEATLRQQFDRARDLIAKDRALLDGIAETLFDRGQISPEGLRQLASSDKKGGKVALVCAPVPMPPLGSPDRKFVTVGKAE